MGELRWASMWLAAAMFGCGGDDDPTLAWAPCHVGQCAALSVPVDHSEPYGEQLELKLARTPARERPSAGVLFYLPGGPGVPVLRHAEEISLGLGWSLPHFDLVLMDPRGVGESSPIDCMGPEFLDRTLPLNASIGSGSDREQSVRELSQFWRAFEDACVDRHGEALLSSLHSESVARDLDLVREALGVPKIHMWAASYGTVQAAVYAKLFPASVGRFLLHLPTFRGTANRIEDLTSIMAAFQHEFERAFRWCAENQRCGLGQSETDVKRAFNELGEQLAQGVTFEGQVVPPASLSVAMAIWIGEGAREDMARALEQAAAGDWRRVVERAKTDPLYESQTDQLAYYQASAVLQLLDFECPRDYSVETAVADLNRAFDAYPEVAEVFALELVACAGWRTRPNTRRVVPTNVTAPPMLLVAGENDPWTPAAAARALLEQLNNHSELVVAEVEGHGVLWVDDQTTEQALQFLEDAEH